MEHQSITQVVFPTLSVARGRGVFVCVCGGGDPSTGTGVSCAAVPTHVRRMQRPRPPGALRPVRVETLCEANRKWQMQERKCKVLEAFRGRSLLLTGHMGRKNRASWIFEAELGANPEHLQCSVARGLRVCAGLSAEGRDGVGSAALRFFYSYLYLKNMVFQF